MREIKFRGMLRSGEWVYGGYVQIKDGADCILSGECAHFDIDGGEKNILKFNAVKYKTVGGYTGLKDKNDTGKETYHKDILALKAGWSGDVAEPGGNYIIDWVDDGWAVIDKDGEYFCGLWEAIFNRGAEVIGNIYENPELLEK